MCSLWFVMCSDYTCQRLFARVCHTAAPLQLLMMLLLGAAWLLPLILHCDDAYDCRVMNNLHRSLDVALTYPDGSPPAWGMSYLRTTSQSRIGSCCRQTCGALHNCEYVASTIVYFWDYCCFVAYKFQCIYVCWTVSQFLVFVGTLIIHFVIHLLKFPWIVC